jgi:putative MATE family efflux protein
MKHKSDLLRGDVRTLFIRYLIPGISAMLMVSLYIFFDTIFIGRGVGSEGLAALNISIPVYNVLFAVGLLFGVGGATAFSVSLGQNKLNKLNDIFTCSIVLSILFGILFTVLGSIFIDELCYFLGASEENFPLVKEYLTVIVLFSFSFIITNTLTVFIRNDKAPKLAMWSTSIGSIANILLDILFIFIFNWGMRGASIATAISSMLSLFILIFFHFVKSNTRLRLNKVKFEPVLLRRIFKNGAPSFIIEISSGVVIFAFNNILDGVIGSIGISAYSIIANISLICAAIFTGIAHAIQPLISINYGAKEMSRVNRIITLGGCFSTGFGILFFITGILLPRPIVSLFNTDSAELMNITVNGIRLYFISFPLMALNIVLGAYFQAIEYSVFSTLISIGRGVGFTLLGLLILPYIFSINGVWLTVPTAELLTLIVSLLFFVRTKFKMRRLLHET